jgi:hypothetical protein
MSSSQRDIARDLEERLALEEADDYSLLQAPSVVSSLAQLSARGPTPSGGEFMDLRPLRAGSLPGSLRGGGGRGVIDMPRGSALPQLAVYIDHSNVDREITEILF